MVDQEGEASDRDDQELHAEGVMVAVVRSTELGEHQVERAVGTDDEDHFHDGVVDGDEAGEQVQVARGEHQRKHDLGLPRHTWQRQREDSANMHSFKHRMAQYIAALLQSTAHESFMMQ